jgi:hypothetical protein
MCPECISPLILAIGGVVSTGSVAALLAKLRSKFNKKKLPAVKFKEET